MWLLFEFYLSTDIDNIRYLIVKVRGKLTRCEADKLEVSVAYLDFYIKPLFFASSINIG